MKNVLLFITLFIATTSIAQTDTTYFNKDGLAVPKLEASFYRIIKKQENDFLVKNISIKSNLPQSIFICSGINPLVKNGFYVDYYSSGAKERKGKYEDNREIGTWIVWDEDGKDSSIVNYTKNGEYKFTRISPNLPYNNGDEIANLVEVEPVFPGGEKAMMEFLKSNIVFPQKEKEEGISGTCFVTFVIEKDGSKSDVRILRGVRNGAGLDAEALRVINLMPNWTPGTINGKNIRVRFNIPLKFYLR